MQVGFLFLFLFFNKIMFERNKTFLVPLLK